ncbi:MAG: DUF4150 domain-containing protein [Sandaracinaceae bacterium]
MFPGSTKAGGMCAAGGGAPIDVCKIPAPPAPFAPAPFPNLVQCPSAGSPASKVKFCNSPGLTKSSSFSRSQGDEAGTLKGLVSPFNMGKVEYKMASSAVKLQGKPAVTVTKMTSHNGASPNAPPGLQVAPSQTSVIIMM